MMGYPRVILLGAALCAGHAWAARTVDALYQFQGGFFSLQSMVSHNGKLYGTEGAPFGRGGETVFELTPPASAGAAWTESQYNVVPVTDGRELSPSLAFDDRGDVYASTVLGGPKRTLPCGTIMQLKPSAKPGGTWVRTTIFEFAAATTCPSTTLVFHDGVLYGAAYGGTYGYGAIFRLTPGDPGTVWSLTTLYRFTRGAEGLGPGPFLFDQSGAIYGLVSGNPNGTVEGANGIVYQLTPPDARGGPWTKTTLYSFSGGSDGAAPTALALGPAGVLYGVTDLGGVVPCGGFSSGCGVVFEVAPPAVAGAAWAESTIYTFTNGEAGAWPNPSLVVDSEGSIYGTTRYGGSGECPLGCGAVFELTPAAGGWAETTIHEFMGTSDGELPQAVLAGSGGALLVANDDPTNTVLEFTPPATAGATWKETGLYGFGQLSDGGAPAPNLTFGSNGALYGTACGGGFWGGGIVFQLTPAGKAWKEQILHSFGQGSDASCPVSGVVMDKNGTLYGAASQGGGASNFADGAIFQLTPPSSPGGNWTESLLYEFAENSTGMPDSLIIDDNGILYGTTAEHASVFELTPPSAPGAAWTETNIYTFSNANAFPVGLAMQNGILYGVTYGSRGRNNRNGYGTLFELTPPAAPGGAWTGSTLHTFKGGTDGANPDSVPIFDNSGTMYGTTAYGGGACAKRSLGCGVVYQFAPSSGGVWTGSILHNFSENDGATGQNPTSLAFRDGTLYGTTCHSVRSGAEGPKGGVLFRLTPPAAGSGAWDEQVLYKFTGSSWDSPTGLCPQGLTLYNGRLYGTTPKGGLADSGTVFRLSF